MLLAATFAPSSVRLFRPAPLIPSILLILSQKLPLRKFKVLLDKSKRMGRFYSVS